MVDVTDLSAEPKERAGKGAARATRNAGRVPAVIYGAKKDPVMITLDPRDVTREINTGNFFSTLYDVAVKGGKERVLPRDIQLHPVSDQAMHVDFLRVSASTEVTVEVSVTMLNEEEVPGLKQGGLLSWVRYQVEVICRADAIPSELEIDLAPLELGIGDSIHASNLDLPDGVRLTITDRDFTIATIAAPTVIEEETEKAEEGGEAMAGEDSGAASEEAGGGEAGG